MASASVTIQLDSLKELSKRLTSPELEKIAQEIWSMQEILYLVAQGIAENFDKERGPNGPWQPLAGQTLRTFFEKRIKSKGLTREFRAAYKIAKERAADSVGALDRRGSVGTRKINQRKLKGVKGEYRKRIGIELQKIEKQMRATAVQIDSGRKKKSQELGNRQILKKTGTLMKSATTPGGANNIYRTEGNNLIFGTNLIYAATHNYGRPQGRGMIPQREFLWLDKQRIDEINDFITAHFVNRIQQEVQG